MRVTKVENNENRSGISTLKAGAIGAAAGFITRSIAPLTKDEYDCFIKAPEVIKENGKNVKEVAKAARPISYFALAGAFVAMSANIISNALKSNKNSDKESKKIIVEKEKPKKEHEDLTMADLVLEGLGSNTEILFLTTHSHKKEFIA